MKFEVFKKTVVAIAVLFFIGFGFFRTRYEIYREIPNVRSVAMLLLGIVSILGGGLIMWWEFYRIS